MPVENIEKESGIEKKNNIDIENETKDHEEREPEEGNRNFSMKFPKPRILTKNEYPDLKTPQPDLFKELINEIIYPAEGSARERYLRTTDN